MLVLALMVFGWASGRLRSEFLCSELCLGNWAAENYTWGNCAWGIVLGGIVLGGIVLKGIVKMDSNYNYMHVSAYQLLEINLRSSNVAK